MRVANLKKLLVSCSNSSNKPLFKNNNNNFSTSSIKPLNFASSSSNHLNIPSSSIHNKKSFLTDSNINQPLNYSSTKGIGVGVGGVPSSILTTSNKNPLSRQSTVGRKKGMITSTALKNSNYQEQEYTISVIENYAREVGISAFNCRTMEYFITQFIDNEAYVNTITMINYWLPIELVMNQKSEGSFLHQMLKSKFPNCYIGFLPRKSFSEDKGKEIYIKSGNTQLSIEELNTKYVCMASFSGLMAYLEANPNYAHTESLIITYYYLENHLNISFQSTLDLELLLTKHFNKTSGSFYSLFSCRTISGCRLLRSNILQPFAIVSEIDKRLNAVNELMGKNDILNEIKSSLVLYRDLEVNISKLMHKMEEPTEGMLRQVLTALQGIRFCIKTLPILTALIKGNLTSEIFIKISNYFEDKAFEEIILAVDELMIDYDLTSNKVTRKQDSIFFLIKEGISNVLDVSRKTYSDTINEIFAEFENLKTSTNDPNIKLCFNDNKGYYITIHESYFIPSNFAISKKNGKKVACANIALISLSERIKEIKSDLLVISIENLSESINLLKRKISYLYVLSSHIALLDVLCAFADFSISGGKMVKPILAVSPRINSSNNKSNNNNNSTSFIYGKNCRHPLLEKHFQSNSLLNSNTCLVPNDYFFISHFNILLLKGANASGKTTYMKQLALLIILSQIGCFVPCDYFHFSIRNFLYTRFDTNDSVEENRGSFIKQIIEIQKVLINHSINCLILLDEPFDNSHSKDVLVISIALLDLMSSKFDGSFVMLSSHNSILNQLPYFYFNVLVGSMVVEFNEESMNFLFKFKFNNPVKAISEGKEDNNNNSINSNELNYGILLADMISFNKNVIANAKMIAEEEMQSNKNATELFQSSNAIGFLKLFLFKAYYYIFELKGIKVTYVIEDEIKIKQQEIANYINNALK